MPVIQIPANFYQQFDADYRRPVPGEGYGGWSKAELPVNTDQTAFIVMHAWDTGTMEEYPGWWRCVEYIPRAYEISKTSLKELVEQARKSGCKIIHIVGGTPYYTECPGYKRAKALVGEVKEPEQIASDKTSQERNDFRAKRVFPGEHNAPDVDRGWPKMDFLADQRPTDDEWVCENSEQLFAVCKKEGINHLIYSGFAINFCLTYSPGGMVDMWRHGITCSAVRQCVTAVENKESARKQLNKEYGLWLASIMSGFIYDLDDLKKAMQNWN